jgi:membrane-bound ClpP family serine protease
MEWLPIVILLLLALIMILVEIIFIPGTTLFGIIGFILAVAGIYCSFRYLGSANGLSIMVGFMIVTAVALYISFKTSLWKRFALNKNIHSRVNDEYKVKLTIGETGRTISALRPSGKAEFENGIVEVHSLDKFLDEKCRIKITRIEQNKIFVEPA